MDAARPRGARSRLPPAWAPRAPSVHGRPADPRGALPASRRGDVSGDARDRPRSRGAAHDSRPRRGDGRPLARRARRSRRARRVGARVRHDADRGPVDPPTRRARFTVSAVSGSRRLSQRISEGDGIAIIVCVRDADEARAAELQGAKAVAVESLIDGIREATSLPLLWLGADDPADADAHTIGADGAPWHADVEHVVTVHDEEELELALERLDPEIFLLSARGH